MSELGYPYEVSTDVPQGVSGQAQAQVLREVMNWCQRACEGRFSVITTQQHATEGTQLDISFEMRTDAQRFKSVFDGKA